MKLSTRELALGGVIIALTAAGAFIKIPLPYIPFTLQTMFVMLAGVLLGSRLGALSQGAYVLLGLAGLPIFALGGGPQYILQPSFGYLLGFVLAAYISGRICGNKRLTFWRALVAALAGTIAVYAIGVPYLYLMKTFLAQPVPFTMILKAGALVFLPADLIKAIVVALVAPPVKAALDARH